MYREDTKQEREAIVAPTSLVVDFTEGVRSGIPIIGIGAYEKRNDNSECGTEIDEYERLGDAGEILGRDGVEKAVNHE